ncbi:guanine nucleotide binding protein (G protein), alpha 15 (Gq class) L homeolog isoform X1 [Xenopus laevis]|uniref:Guanine nucleotide binding protein (G protein), alpha 15 (Gq class) L homeolog isoform X1 n=2 Tax=Xenopus laevis TaxID=8355 RepID=A0A1L8HWX0_XENLA|nr:guanine nucleotide binding protein (G protein), alpha 15 (Gq class) L homeolog isoform X1 [Xenopus laevis]OCU00606.1 hypothetical protein XELAEV_18006384mg [Xenopus laevis]
MPWWCCGCFFPPCISEEEITALTVNREIERILKLQKERSRAEIKLLLLGTGESGKSTFIKQMRIIHGTGFSEQERKFYARLVHQNIVTCAQSLVWAMETLQVPYTIQNNQLNGSMIRELYAFRIQRIEEPHVKAISKLWSDTGIQRCYERRREFQLLDSTNYYLSNLERLTQDGYQPTDEDILRIRMPTTGINEYCFSVENMDLRMVDVGGQKSERRKWIHSFENVSALIYLASLSEYDQKLEENSHENRMKESFALFRNILELPWFRETPIILFLNKTDLLEEKIGFSDLSDYFPRFKGSRCDAEAAKQFILDIYQEIFDKIRKQDASGKDDLKHKVYHHFTCATDTDNIRKVFHNVKEAVLVRYLVDFGIL